MPDVLFDIGQFPCQIRVANANLAYNFTGNNFDEQQQALRDFAARMQGGSGELAENINALLDNPEGIQGDQLVQQLFGAVNRAMTTEGQVLAYSQEASLLVSEDDFIDCGVRLLLLL